MDREEDTQEKGDGSGFSIPRVLSEMFLLRERLKLGSTAISEDVYYALLPSRPHHSPCTPFLPTASTQ